MMNKENKIKKSILVKLGILSVVLLFIGSSFVSSLSHTVDYSNASYWTDDRHTRIYNSNGNYWEATGPNLILAVADLDEGTVFLPEGTIEMTTKIDNVCLDMEGKTIFIKGAGRDSTKIKQADDLNCTRFIDFRDCDGGGLSDLTIDTNYPKNNQDSGMVVTLNTNSSGLLFENLKIENTIGNCIQLSDDSIANNILIINVSDHPSGSFQAIGGGSNNIYSNIIIKEDLSTNGHGFSGMDFNNPADKNVVVDNLLLVNISRIGKIINGASNITLNDVKAYGLLDPGGIYAFEILEGENITVNGMSIRNHSKPTTSNSGTGIIIGSDAYNIFLNDIFVSDRSGRGMYIAGENVFIDGAIVENCKGTPLYITSASYVTANKFISRKSSTASLMADSNNIRITNSIFNENTASYGFVVDTSYNFSFDNCEFNDNYNNGIYIGSGNCYNFKIGNSDVINNGYGGDFGGIRIAGAHTFTNFSIHDNIIKNNDNDGIRLYSGITVYDSIITDNRLYNNRLANIDDDSVGNNLVIKDNIGYDNSTYQYIPCGTETSIYSSPDDGAMMFVEGNQTLAVYHGSRWYYYDHNG